MKVFMDMNAVIMRDSCTPKLKLNPTPYNPVHKHTHTHTQKRLKSNTRQCFLSIMHALSFCSRRLSSKFPVCSPKTIYHLINYSCPGNRALVTILLDENKHRMKEERLLLGLYDSLHVLKVRRSRKLFRT